MNKHLCLFYLNLFLVLSFIGFSVFIILDPDAMNGVTLEEYNNTFCQTYNKTGENDPVELICENKFKKKKFIWVLLDGLAFDQLFLLPNRTVNPIPNFFRIKSKEYKQSGSLHESILTGKFSRNYPAKKIKIDTIFKQAHQAEIKMIYRGSSFPVFYLLGRENNGVLSRYELKGPEPYALYSFCPGSVNNIFDGFPDSLRKETTDEATGHLLPNYDKKYIYEKLIEHYKDNTARLPDSIDRCIAQEFNSDRQSYIYYTMRIDHLNHSFDKHYIGTIFDIFTLESTIIGLKNWIDAHSDYALIVSSDHGGQPFNGQDNICNHGCDIEGNEAILMVYTREISTLKVQMDKIWVYDVAPTVSQILSGVNIPLEAQGEPRLVADDNILRYTAVKSKQIQLIQYLNKYIEKFPNAKKGMRKYIEKLEKNEFEEKIKSKDDVEKKADQNYFISYGNYLRKISEQIEIDIAAKGKNSIFYSVRFYVIWIILLIKVVYQYKKINLIVKQDNEKTLVQASYLLCDFIIIALIGEVIICFFYTRMKLDDLIGIIRVSEFGFIALLTLFIVFKYKMNNLFKYVILFITLCIVSTFMLKYELFINMKIYFDTEHKSKMFNFLLNYPIAVLYLIYELYPMRKYYIDARLKIRLLYINIPYILITFVLFIIFDYYEKAHFSHHTTFSFRLTRIIYGVISIFALFAFKPLYKKSSYGIENKDPIQSKKVKSIPNAKIAMFLFVYYICDETERSITLITFIIASAALSNQFIKSKNVYWRMICSIALVMLPDVIFVSTQNSFSFDISLKVTSKVIGKYADQTPIMTGILFGCHKLKLFMLTAGYIISIAKTSKNKFMKDETFMLRMIIDIQMTFIIALYFYYLKTGMEMHYLQIFMWIMSKCMTSVLFDLAFSLWYVVYKCAVKCKQQELGTLVGGEEKEGEAPSQVVIELASNEK